MATSVVALTGASAANQTAYDLGTISCAPQKLYLFAVAATSASDPGDPTLNGPLTGFSLLASVVNPGSVVSRCSLFQGTVEAGSVGAATATWGFQMSRAAWILIEITGGGAAAQSVTASLAATTSVSASLAALRGTTSDVVAFGMHHVNEGHTPGASLGELADVTTGEAFAINAMTGDNITSLGVSWTSSARGGIVGVEIPNLQSLVSSSTWTFGVASILSKLKSLVSASTWTVTVGSILEKVFFWLLPTSPDTQTLTSRSPDTQTLTAASPDTQTLTGASPDESPPD